MEGKGQLLDARKVTGRLRGRLQLDDDEWLYPDAPTPGTANVFTLHDEIVINEVMYHHQPNYGMPDWMPGTTLRARFRPRCCQRQRSANCSASLGPGGLGQAIQEDRKAGTGGNQVSQGRQTQAGTASGTRALFIVKSGAT
jgi:hypothetical protein